MSAALALVAMSWPGQAAGQSEADKARATKLFEEALALLDRGETSKACDLLEEAFGLARGVGIQFQLATCYESIGKTASAHRNFVEAAEVARRAGQDERATVAAERAAALGPRLTKLLVQVDAPAPGMTVHYNDHELARAKWSTAVAVDPGRYTLRAEAPEHEPWSEERDMSGEGATITVAIPPLVGMGGEAASSWTVLHTVGVVVGGVGVVAMGVSIGLAVSAKAKDDAAAEHCDESGCDEQGLELNDKALTRGNIATGVFIGGAVCAAAGAGLLIYAFMTGDEAESAAFAPIVSPNFWGLRGAF